MLYQYNQKNTYFVKFVLIILLFTACGEKKNVNQPPSHLSFNEETEDKTCSYHSYLNSIFNKDNKIFPNSILEEKFFTSMENHSYSLKNFNHTAKTKSPISSSNCKLKCNNLNLNRIYESLLAKKIMENNELKNNFSTIFFKIFHSMKHVMGTKLSNESIHNWAKLKDDEITFPSLQRQKQFTGATPELPSKERAMKYAIGLFNDTNGNNNPNPNSALQLDYLLFNAKGNDQISRFPFPIKEFRVERDYFFNSIVRRLRGYRGNQVPKNKTNHYGISYFDIDELKAPTGSISWRNWGRDSCINELQSNLYTNAVHDLQIPLTCGISGTTNLLLWSLMAHGVELNETEMRLLLLLTWSTLSMDTGHSLQEVLTMTKLSAIYFRGLLQSSNPKLNFIKNKIPIVTLESLEKVTESMQALSYYNNDVSYTYEDKEIIFNRIYEHEFTDSNDVVAYYKPFPSQEEKKSFEQDSQEKKKRKELEYFYNFNDNINSNQAYFGKYYDSFFSKIKETNFTNARIQAQTELKNYFIKSCLK